jgi:hypothetical protein
MAGFSAVGNWSFANLPRVAFGKYVQGAPGGATKPPTGLWWRGGRWLAFALKSVAATSSSPYRAQATGRSITSLPCTEALSVIKLDYERLAPMKQGLCGTPAPIVLKSLGNNPKVELDPPVVVTCVLAKA